MRIARLAVAAPLAVLVLSSACLNDRPVNGLGDKAALALRVIAPKPATTANASTAPAPQQSVEVFVGIGCYNCATTGKAPLAPGVLFDQTYPVGSGTQRIAATFPLGPCNGYYPPDNLGPYCDVEVQITLRSDSTVVATQYLYSIRVRPGVVTQTDSVFFGALTTGNAQRGVKVAADMVAYRLDASSAFGGIVMASTWIIDSTGCYCNTTTQFFGQAYPSISGGTPALYAVVPGLTAMQYYAQVIDVHGNTSYPAEQQGIDPPNGNVAPYVYAVTSDTTTDSLLVSATGFSVLASTQQIDFVVHSLPNQFAQDTIYMVCSVAAPGQFSTAAGGCRRSGPHFTAAMVDAIPVDSIYGAGFGANCGLGLVCNYGTIYPQRRQ